MRIDLNANVGQTPDAGASRESEFASGVGCGKRCPGRR